MIQLESVDKVYRTSRIETLALSGVDINIEKGEFISVMGPSGCGKSTLLNMIGLLDKPTRGSVTLAGQRVESYADRELARLRNEKIGITD